jgi:hypothetical protein
MNEVHEKKHQGLKEMILCEVGQRFKQLAADPRGCWFGGLYELELPPDTIAEMLDDCNV